MKKQTTDSLATKKDLEKLATKKDLDKLAKATKKDLDKLATKKELEKLAVTTKKDLEELRLATGKDLNREVRGLEKVIKSLEKRSLAFEWKIETKIDAYQQQIEKLIKDFRSEILKHLNGTMKELETVRQKQTIIGHQVTDHEEKLENHEKRITTLEQPVTVSA